MMTHDELNLLVERARQAATISLNGEFLLELADAIEILQAERTVAQSNEACYAKVLFRLRQTLMLIQDNIEDEGDRVYFGSTNDADDLKEVAQKIDGLKWDNILESSQPRVDLYELLAEQRERAEAAEALVAKLRAGLRPFAELGEFMCDKNGWGYTDLLSLETEMTRIATIAAAHFRRASDLLAETGPQGQQR